MKSRADGLGFALGCDASLVGGGVGGVLGYFSPLVPPLVGLVHDAVINFFDFSLGFCVVSCVLVYIKR